MVRVRPGVKAGVNPRCEKEAFLMFMSEAIDYIMHFTNMMEYSGSNRNRGFYRAFAFSRCL